MSIRFFYIYFLDFSGIFYGLFFYIVLDLFFIFFIDFSCQNGNPKTGKISGSDSDDGGNEEFAEFMRWKQQKRKANRRGIDDWDQDNWTEAPQRPVNRAPSSGYSSASSSRAVQGTVENIFPILNKEKIKI